MLLDIKTFTITLIYNRMQTLKFEIWRIVCDDITNVILVLAYTNIDFLDVIYRHVFFIIIII